MTSATRKRVLAAAAAAAAVLAGGAIAANATIGANEAEHETSTENAYDDAAEDAAEGPDQPTGPDLKTAEQAALAHLGEGRVTGTEAGDEESYYEVEGTLDSGKQVDVQLDEQFNVVGTN